MRTLTSMLILATAACGGSDATKTKTDQPPPEDYQPKLTETAERAVSDLRAAPPAAMGQIAPMPFGGADAGEEPVTAPPDADRDAACAAFWRDTEPFARAFIPAYGKLARTLRDASVTGKDVLEYLVALDDQALTLLAPVKVTYAPLAGPYRQAVDNLRAQRDAAATGFARAEAGDQAAARAAFDGFVGLVRQLDDVGDAITDVCPMPAQPGAEEPTTESPPTPPTP